MHIHGDHKTGRYFVINRTLEPPPPTSQIAHDNSWELSLQRTIECCPCNVQTRMGRCVAATCTHGYHIFFFSHHATAAIKGVDMGWDLLSRSKNADKYGA
jgi:hypothetical protein